MQSQHGFPMGFRDIYCKQFPRYHVYMSTIFYFVYLFASKTEDEKLLDTVQVNLL
jgi:hypothetical protein